MFVYNFIINIMIIFLIIFNLLDRKHISLYKFDSGFNFINIYLERDNPCFPYFYDKNNALLGEKRRIYIVV